MGTGVTSHHIVTYMATTRLTYHYQWWPYGHVTTMWHNVTNTTAEWGGMGCHALGCNWYFLLYTYYFIILTNSQSLQAQRHDKEGGNPPCHVKHYFWQQERYNPPTTSDGHGCPVYTVHGPVRVRSGQIFRTLNPNLKVQSTKIQTWNRFEVVQVKKVWSRVGPGANPVLSILN